MNVSVSSAYDLADALNQKLYLIDGLIRGSETKDLLLGGWLVQTTNVFVSDELNSSRVSGFFRVSKDLWLYLLSEAHANILKAWVVDGATAKLTVADVRSFGTKNYKKTLEKLGTSVVASFFFDGKKWNAIKRKASVDLD